MPVSRIVFALAASLVVSGAYGDTATLRVATWNISQYRSGRVSDIQNVVYGVNSANGLSMRPDVIMAQEIQSADAATAFLAALNGTTDGPRDWAASYAPLTGTSASSNANDQAVFYRASKVSISSAPIPVLTATSTSGAARQVYRWDLKLANDANDETLSVYNNHLKSGAYNDGNNGVTNAQRRKVATDAIRADANSLPASYHALFGGDMNVQTSTETDYQSLVGSQSNDRGRFFDPIGTPGSWNGSNAYRFVHTQDPSGTGGMDDRHDQILLDSSFGDGQGLEYVGRFGTKYSTTTWNDPNHSYRVWGNDGTSFNSMLTTTGNTMVGASIAQSLINTATSSGGHLPVFLDLSYTVNATPEPASLAALGIGLVAFLRRRRK